MTRRILQSLTLAAALSPFLGCGGAGSSTSLDSFAGSWASTFTSRFPAGSLLDQGTLAVSVASDGTLSGTATQIPSNATGAISGSIQLGGSMVMIFRFPTDTGNRVYLGRVAVSNGQLRPTASDGRLYADPSSSRNGSIEFILAR